jgi:hypothetical protein
VPGHNLRTDLTQRVPDLALRLARIGTLPQNCGNALSCENSEQRCL